MCGVCMLYIKHSVLAKSDMHLDACAVKPKVDVERKKMPNCLC